MAPPSTTKEHKISTNLKVALMEANKNIASNKNFVCSPLGIEILLSILAAGSSGETRKQIMKFLGSKTVKAINKKASRIMDIVSPDYIDGKCSKGPLVSFVNGAWVDLQRFSLRPAFQKLLEETYKAEAKAVDFGRKDEVCKEVNLWASKATQGLIDQVLSPDSLKEDSMLILGNALFFKAAWQRPLNFCKNRQFHLLSGDTIEASFISAPYLQHTYDGAFFDTFRLLRIPYKRGADQDARDFAMYIFLPNAEKGLVDLMQRFSEDSSFFDRKFELEAINVTEFWIPKFKFSHEFSAKNTLKQLGLDRMFMSAGEITRIVDKSSAKLLSVSDVCQKSFVEVNEEGTVATSVSLKLSGGGYMKHFSFVADHPFMFMIRDDTSGVTFFVGAVLNPASD